MLPELGEAHTSIPSPHIGISALGTNMASWKTSCIYRKNRVVADESKIYGTLEPEDKQKAITILINPLAQLSPDWHLHLKSSSGHPVQGYSPLGLGLPTLPCSILAEVISNRGQLHENKKSIQGYCSPLLFVCFFLTRMQCVLSCTCNLPPRASQL